MDDEVEAIEVIEVEFRVQCPVCEEHRSIKFEDWRLCSRADIQCTCGKTFTAVKVRDNQMRKLLAQS